jgi:rhodanese-related sulfurtransferase
VSGNNRPIMGRTISAVLFLALAACAKAPAPEQRIESNQAAPAEAVKAPAHAATDPHASFTRLPVQDVAGLLESKKARAVDANGADTRKEYGTLPGAVLLSNARTFDATELPQDKSTELVFYCGSTSCNAAPKAAARAQELGYTAVKVMPEGIRGWVKAGKPVDKLDV